jgi:hypothetical protein
MLEQVHTGLDRRNLLPDEHIVDAGYTSAERMLSTRNDFNITLIDPLRVDHSPQARTRSGFDRTAFTINWDNHRVICPQSVTNTIWSSCTERGRPSIVVRFPAPTCQVCPVRAQCRHRQLGRLPLAERIARLLVVRWERLGWWGLRRRPTRGFVSSWRSSASASGSYHRFPLSFREVEEMMLERGIVVSHETIRQWCATFGQTYANALRRRRARPGGHVAP